MSLRSIAEVKHLSGKTVLVRIDTNVPLKGKHVVDDSRLREAVPTIRFLERKGAKVVLLGHLGRPAGKMVISLSLKPVGYALGKILRQPVKVLPFIMKPEAIRREAAVGVVLLENIRFHPGEDNNSQVFARTLAHLGQIYVNEAFSCSHRPSASLVSLARKLPAVAGFQFVNEVNSLERVRRSGAKPVVAIVGGAKISDKLPVIKKLIPRLSAVLVGGGVASTLLKAKGYKVGKSLVDPTAAKSAKILLRVAGKKLILPLDVVVDNVGTARAEARLRQVNQIRSNERIVDLGTATCRLYAKQKLGLYFGAVLWVWWRSQIGNTPPWR